MPLRLALHKVVGGTWGETTIIGGSVKREFSAESAAGRGSGERFVGRKQTLEALSELLHESAGGRSAAYIEGESGVGKTRLLEVHAEAACEAGFRVLWGRPQQFAEHFPYLAFLQILSQLHGVDGSEHQVGGKPLSRYASSEWASLAVDTRAARTRFILDVCETIVAQAASTPTLILVDDLQWADIASLLLISSLLDTQSRGLVLVCAARPDDSERPDIRGLLRTIHAGSKGFNLGGLEMSELDDFVTELLGRGKLSAAEVSALHAWTNGNPLFIKELLAHLDSNGLLADHGLDEALRRSDMPNGVSTAVRARVEGLGTRVRRTLAAAAVIGDEFNQADVALVLADTIDRVAGQFATALELGLLGVTGDLGRERLRFRHPLFRKALYDLQAPSEQQALHHRITQVAGQGLMELSEEELAIHHAASSSLGVSEEAVGHCRAAATHAEGLLAFESAARFWEMGLGCSDRTDELQSADLLKRQGWALWAANSWNRGEEVWTEAVQLYERLGETDEVGELALALGDMLRWRQDVKPSEEWLERALVNLARASPNRARALALLGSIYSLRDASENGLALLREAVTATDEAGVSDARIDFWLSYGLQRAGDRERGVAVAKRGLRSAELAEDVHGTVMLAGELARIELTDLRPAAAEPYVSKMQSLADQADTTALMMILQTQVYHLGYAGSWQRVAEFCESMMGRVRLAGSYQVATARVFWAEAQAAMGECDVAVAALEDALPHLERMQDVCRIHIARVLASSGDGAKSIRDVEYYLEAALQPGSVRSGMPVLADAAAGLGAPELWQPAYDLLAKETGVISLVFSPTSVSRVRGRLATRLKQWTDAVDHFEAAAAHLTEGGAIWELLRTYQDYAVMRRARGRRGDSGKADTLDMIAAQILNRTELAEPPVGVPYATELQANEYGLSGREVEVLQLVARGLRNKEIAEELTLSRHTVERHLENIYSKMGAKGRADAVIRAAEASIIVGGTERLDRVR